MIYIAFTLGLFGSLHCMGMCGPLAMGVSRYSDENVWSKLWHALKYNFGRIATYAGLGLVFGFLGQGIVMGGFQKTFSVIAGVVLVLLFLFSFDFERLFFKWKLYTHWDKKIKKRIGLYLSRQANSSPFSIGLLNGLIPCGLVYLALAGAITSGGIIPAIIFMVVFGLGTLPSLLFLMLGTSLKWLRSGFAYKRIYPLMHLILGAILIYRGLAVEVPTLLDFQMGNINPDMCH
ncbi:MAG: sulfite exporter TauE/SafE family protein [Saprospiraceae bacterium]|nr:sulfite exporter TauE/SafE family protein [Saprospiraceae bacterium]